MAQRPVGVNDRPAAAGIVQYRTRERNVGGTNVVEQFVLYERLRPLHWGTSSGDNTTIHCCTTPRIPGVASANQNLASLYLPDPGGTGGPYVTIRHLSVLVQKAAALAAPRVIGCSRITTNPTTGTVMVPTEFDTLRSTPWTEFRAGASADGALSTLTAAAGTYGAKEFAMRLHSAANHVVPEMELMVPRLSSDEPVILRANEGLLVTAIDAPVATDSYIVNVVFEEVQDA